MKYKDKKVNEYTKPKNKNAVIILSTGFFLWGKSMGYKGLSVGEVSISHNICEENSYGRITKKENIGKIVICNSHGAFLEEKRVLSSNMSASGVVIPAFNFPDELDRFLVENQISAIYDVDTLALMNRIRKEGTNKVSALIFNVPDVPIDINTLYGFLTAFNGKNNKTEQIHLMEHYDHVYAPMSENIFVENSNNFNTLNTHINGSLFFKYHDNYVHVSRVNPENTNPMNSYSKDHYPQYPSNREEMEELKKHGLSDMQIAHYYDKHYEIVGHNRTEWGNFPSYKLYDGLYVPIYAGDGLNNGECQLDFPCNTLVLAHDHLDDEKIQSILYDNKTPKNNVYVLTNNVNLINNLKSKYLQTDKTGYPINLAIILAKVNYENILDILNNNNEINQVYYHNKDHIEKFQMDFMKKEIDLINCS